jgi:hypothetical protein
MVGMTLVTVGGSGGGPAKVSELPRLASVEPLFPPATRTLPSLSKVDVKCSREVDMEPSIDHVLVPGE